MLFKFLRIISLAVLLPCLGIPFSLVSQADVAESSPEGIVEGELVVELRPGASIDAVNARNDTSTIQRMGGTNFYRLRIPSGKTEKQWRIRLAADPDVLSSSSNRVVASPISVFARRTMAFPDNVAEPGHTRAEYASQEGLESVLKLDKALVRSRGKGVVVAVIDTGVDLTHPELASHMWTNPHAGISESYPGDEKGWNFVERNGDPSDPPGDPKTSVAGHGTCISGLIALVAPDALIMPIRAFPSNGVGDAFTVAEAIKFAADHSADIINLSFGCPSRVGVLHDAIADARRRGIVMAAAVGNDNDDTTQFPAGFNRVLGVGATDLQSHRAPFSNFGTDVSVDAPGVSLISTYPRGDFAKWSGTSFAAPLVAAEAALILAHDRLTSDPAGTIRDTARSIDDLNPEFKGRLGRGLIDPLAALKSLYSGDRVQEFKDLYAEVAMTSGPVEQPAQGTVYFSSSRSGRQLGISALLLKPRADYKFVVDGFRVGMATSSNMGSLTIEIPSKAELPFQLANIKHVEVLDAQDQTILKGDFGPVGSGFAPAGEVVEKEAWLESKSSEWKAGRAVAVIDSKGQTLVIEGDGLRDGASYQLIADGVNVGSFVALTGFCSATLTTDGSGSLQLPKSLWPATNIKHIEMRDTSGTIVILKGDFKPIGGDIGKQN